MYYSLFFLIFSALMLISAIFVIASSNAVKSVLWLICVFCNAAALFLLLGAEFLSMVLVIVYVGAVAVMFLFVVMMIDFNEAEQKPYQYTISNIASSLLVLGILTPSLLFLISRSLSRVFPVSRTPYTIPDMNTTSNTHAIGKILYTDFILPFQVSGLILLIAIIGCIFLTLNRSKTNIKKQASLDQLSRNKENSLIIISNSKDQ